MARRRIRVLLALLFLVFGVLLGRLASIQLRPEVQRAYARLGIRQHTDLRPLFPRRGRILDRRGRVLARDRAQYRVVVEPRRLDPWPRRRILRRVLAEVAEERPEFAPDPAAVEAHLVRLAREALAAGDDGPRTLIEDLPLEAAGRIADYIAEVDRAGGGTDGASGLSVAWGSDDPDLTFRPHRVLRPERVIERLARAIGSPWTAGRLTEAWHAAQAEVRGRIRRELDRLSDEEARRKEATIRYLCWHDVYELVPSVDLEAVTAIEYAHESLPGISVEDRSRRVYPLGEAAGTLAGYLRSLISGEDEENALREAGKLLRLGVHEDLEDFAARREGVVSRDALGGVTGLEGAYDDELRGTIGMRLVQVDRQGHIVGEDLDRLPAVHGADLRTTLDAELQKRLFEALRRRVRKLGARAGSVAVMELAPERGALRASVGWPGYDPNRMREDGYRAERQRELGEGVAWQLDRPHLAAVEPGSVFKIVTAIAAFTAGRGEDGRPPPLDVTCACDGTPYVVEGRRRTFDCYARWGHGMDELALRDALEVSCNMYFYSLAHHWLEPERLRAWAEAFGFGRPPGLDAVGVESLARGRLLGPDDRRIPEGDICAYAIGQQFVTATPLQVLRCLGAVALRCRELPTPWLVRPAEPEPLPSVRPEVVDAIRSGLERVVESPRGTASDLRRFRVAAKTGSAEFVTDGKRYHAWLAGYGPVPGPRFAFVVVIERSPEHGGESCAPVAETLLEWLAEHEEPGLLRAGGSPDP